MHSNLLRSRAAAILNRSNIKSAHTHKSFIVSAHTAPGCSTLITHTGTTLCHFCWVSETLNVSRPEKKEMTWLDVFPTFGGGRGSPCNSALVGRWGEFRAEERTYPLDSGDHFAPGGCLRTHLHWRTRCNVTEGSAGCKKTNGNRDESLTSN